VGCVLAAYRTVLHAPQVIAILGARRSIAMSIALLAVCMTTSPFSRVLAIAVLLYGLMGSARGISGVAMNTGLMEQVPSHFMGRVQNTFYFAGTLLRSEERRVGKEWSCWA